jgi:Nuclease-related domain
VDERAWAAFGAFKAGITGHKGESAVALAGLGYSALHDVLQADLFGLTQVDHLVRGPDRILVIETKRYGGHITRSLRGDV